MKVWDFLFPNVCRHCKEGWGVLCQECLEYVEFLEVEEGGCLAYEHRRCFEACGPILSLCQGLGAMKALAAMMVLQNTWIECDGIVGEGLLGEHYGKMVGIKRARKPWADKVLLVVSVKELDYKSRRRLFRNYPRRVINLSAI